MQANLYGQDSSGDWVPVRVAESGQFVGSGGSALPTSQPELLQPWSYAAASGGIIDTEDVTLVAAAGSGKANYVTSLQVMNSSATATELVIKSGSTVLWRAKVGATMIAPVDIQFLRPLFSANNTALTAACITTGTATYLNVQGYQDGTISNINAGLTLANELFTDAGDQLFDDAGSPIYLAA